MSFTKWSATALAVLLFVGCSDTATPTADAPADSTASTTASASESQDEGSSDEAAPNTDMAAVDTDAPSGQQAEPAPKESAYLALPPGVNPRLAQAYAQVTEQAASGGAEALLSLADISQRAGGEASKSDPALGYAFFKQSAKALREGAATYDKELPGGFTGPIFYNEACALAKEDDVEGAMASLEEAINSGFSDFGLLGSDSDLEAVRAVDGFEDKLKAWETAAAEAAKAHAIEELANGETFPFEFTLTDIDGAEVSLADYKGKVVIVDIWGTWCPPCREEIPSFIKLQDKFGDKGFQMLGLNYERGASEEANIKLVVDYAKENGINYPCIMGDAATRAQVPDFGGFPTTMFVDKTGKVRLKAVGLHDYGYLEAIVSELLAEEVPEDLGADK